jgi:NADPH:quinone reductase-like Zn-dependent oxidoreductase
MRIRFGSSQGLTFGVRIVPQTRRSAFLLGDVLSTFAGDFAHEEIAGQQVAQGIWLLIAAITLTPIIMVVLSLVLPYPVGSLGLHCGGSALGHLQSDRLALRWGVRQLPGRRERRLLCIDRLVRVVVAGSGPAPGCERMNRRPMRAIVCTDYGPPDVLQLRDVLKPVPKDNEVLVRIRATTVSAADCELRRFDFAPWIWVPIRLAFGIRRPRQPVLGQELAGDVDSVGKEVTSLRKGDRVFATTGIGLGAYAEYICLRANPQTGTIATMPANLSYEEAAAVPYGGGEALGFLRKANIRTGQRVLVNGAGGSFGTFAVQLAKVLGAHVTAVDSGPKLEMLRTIGADRVIDYSQEDFTGSPETYDVIFDVVRNTPSGRMVNLLTDSGYLLMANPGFLQIVRARWASRGSKKRVSLAASSRTSEDLAYLRGLVEAGRLRPVIDRLFPLEQMVEAHRYAEAGQKLGNVVVVVA